MVTSGGTIKIHAGSYAGDADASAKAVTLDAGTSPAQVSIAGNLVLTNDDTTPFEINGTNPLTDYDNYVVGGSVSLGAATFTLSRGFNPVPGNSFTIINKTSPGLIPDTFNGLAEGSTITVGGVPFTISYQGGDGNDVVLTVGQPSTVYVNDTWLETSNTSGGTPGIVEVGDLVQSDTGAGDSSITGLTFGINAFATVQDAINAVATSGTVDVLNGSYVQQLEISRNLTVQRFGVGSATIQSPAGTLAKSFSFTGWDSTTWINRPVVWVHDTDSVTLKSLVIDGDKQGAANDRFVGRRIRQRRRTRGRRRN